jgi:hypothetical protein
MRKILLMSRCLLVLRKIFAWTKLASQRPVSEPSDDLTKLLWMLVKYRLLPNQ